MKKVLLGMVVLVMLMLFSVSTWAGSIEIKWSPNTEPDLTGYIVYYTEEGGTEQSVDVGNEITWKLEGLVTGSYYLIEVTAYDASGNESEKSYGVRTKAKYSKVDGLEVIG